MAMAAVMVATGMAMVPGFVSAPDVATKIARVTSPSMPSQFVSVNVSSGRSGAACTTQPPPSVMALVSGAASFPGASLATASAATTSVRAASLPAAESGSTPLSAFGTVMLPHAPAVTSSATSIPLRAKKPTQGPVT